MTAVPGGGFELEDEPIACWPASPTKSLLAPVPNGGVDGGGPSPPPPQALPRANRERIANLRVQKCMTDMFAPLRSVSETSSRPALDLLTPCHWRGNLN